MIHPWICLLCGTTLYRQMAGERLCVVDPERRIFAVACSHCVDSLVAKALRARYQAELADKPRQTGKTRDN